MVFIPGGFSAGDEPDGSGKFITAFFRNSLIKEAVSDLLDNRDGLMAGICNGFQALIKMGLLPYGKIIDTDESFPTLAINTIGRHQSMITRIRIATNNSPWLKNTRVGEIYNVPVSHGEGRFIANDNVLDELYKNGQIFLYSRLSLKIGQIPGAQGPVFFVSRLFFRAHGHKVFFFLHKRHCIMYLKRCKVSFDGGKDRWCPPPHA